MNQFNPNDLIEAVSNLNRAAADIKSVKGDVAEFLSKQKFRSSSKREQLSEALNQFYHSDAAQMTVREMLSSTGSVALPSMVQAAALLELGVWTDGRDLCMKVAVPKGAGKTVDTQLLTAPNYDEWSEGSALAAADPALVKRTITMKPFGKVTLISDFLANTSAVNFTEQVGKLHGAAVRKGIYQYVINGLSSCSGGSLSAASGSTLTFTEAANAVAACAAKGFQSDFITCSPASMWTAFTTNYAVQQFTGALADTLAKGVKPNAFGLDWYAEPFFTTASPGTMKTLAYVGTKGVSAVWASLQDEPTVEIYRLPTALSNYVITHMDGGAQGGIADSITTITYQS